MVKGIRLSYLKKNKKGQNVKIARKKKVSKSKIFAK